MSSPGRPFQRKATPMASDSPLVIDVPGMGRIITHTDVVLRLSFRDLTFLLQGQEVHLGRVPASVQEGHHVMVSVPEMQTTYIVTVARVYRNSAYGQRSCQHFEYLEPTN